MNYTITCFSRAQKDQDVGWKWECSNQCIGINKKKKQNFRFSLVCIVSVSSFYPQKTNEFVFRVKTTPFLRVCNLSNPLRKRNRLPVESVLFPSSHFFFLYRELSEIFHFISFLPSSNVKSEKLLFIAKFLSLKNYCIIFISLF